MVCLLNKDFKIRPSQCLIKIALSKEKMKCLGYSDLVCAFKSGCVTLTTFVKYELCKSMIKTITRTPIFEMWISFARFANMS